MWLADHRRAWGWRVSEDSPSVGQPPAQGGISSRKEKRATRAQTTKTNLARMVRDFVAPRLEAAGGERIHLKLQDLEGAILADSDLKERRRQLFALAELLKDGERQGTWTISALPDAAIRKPKRSSPFRPDKMRVAPLAALLRNAHQKALSDFWFPSDRKGANRSSSNAALITQSESALAEESRRADLVGQILFSAMFYGGLIHLPWARMLMSRLREHLHHANGLVWIDFPAFAKGGESENETDSDSAAAVRRWFPDPVTTALILRWQLAGESVPDPQRFSFEPLLKHYVKSLSAKLRLDTTSKQWIAVFPNGQALAVEASQRKFDVLIAACARADLTLVLPPLLAQYAVTLDHAQSPTLRTWARLVCNMALQADGNKVLPTVSDELFSLAPKGPPDEMQPTRSVSSLERMDAQLQLVKQFRAALSVKDRAPAQTEMRKILETVKNTHPVYFVGQWLLVRLSQSFKGQAQAVPSSALRYLTSIGDGTAIYGNDLQNEDFSIDGEADLFCDLYDAIVEGKKSAGDRSYATGRLKEFHSFLVSIGKAPRIEWDGAASEGQKTAHANYLSEQDFADVVSSIVNSKMSMRDKELFHLVAICGFRLGLRRKEIVGLECRDLQGFSWKKEMEAPHTRYHLRIHSNSKARVKRRSSVRRLPLFHLLAKDESELFVRWARRRKTEIGPGSTGSERLFTADLKSDKALQDRDAFAPISMLMQKVTGDDDLTFHCLRHSFVTLTLSQWLNGIAEMRLAHTSGKVDLAEFGVQLPPSYLGAPTAPKNQIERLLPSKQFPREAAYLMAGLAGHIDPAETVGSYSHGLDLALRNHLLVRVPPLTEQECFTLCAMTAGAARVAKHRAKKENGESTSPLPSTLPLAIRHLIQKAGRRDIFTSLPALRPRSPTPHVLTAKAENQWPTLESVYSFLLARWQNQPANDFLSGTEWMREGMDERLLEVASHYSARGKTNFRDEGRRQSRSVKRAAGSGQSIDARQLPEVPGLGRALPKSHADRAQATSAFERLLAAFEQDAAFFSIADQVHGCGHRSGAELFINSAENAKQLLQVLEVLEIGKSRLRIQFLSASKRKSDTIESQKNAVKTFFDITASQVGVPSALPVRAGKKDFPRIAVRVMKSGSEAQQSDSAWRVGLFYSLLVWRATRLYSKR